MPQSRRAPSADRFVDYIFGEDFHHKRVESLAGATRGALVAATLSVAAIGPAYALARGLESKHGIKQVDRLLSNKGFDMQKLFASWVPFVVAERKEIVVTLDWTDFDANDQATLVLGMITRQGRVTPLMWQSTGKGGEEGWKSAQEDELLERFEQVLPEG